MNANNEYTIELVLKSPVITPFQSDILFGHICWAIRFLYGTKSRKLDDFLESFDHDSFPPLLISNGFPHGLLAKPIIAPIAPKDLDDIMGQFERNKASTMIKTVMEQEYIPKRIISSLQESGPITPKKLFSVMIENFDDIVLKNSLMRSTVVQHNAINRIKQETTGLYFQDELFFENYDNIFDIYLRSSYFSKSELEVIFEFIGEQGFGKDKSTGKGYFDFEIKEEHDLPEAANPNAFMSLSSFIPNETAPLRGSYKILHKYGKLGGTYAKGTLDGNPFKKPLLMFVAGSTFYDKDFCREKVYGLLVNNVHAYKQIKHYAYAFPLGLRINEELT